MTNKIYKLYKNLFDKYGDDPASVKARTHKQQQLRFKYLFKYINIKDKDTILDIGSGLGDLLFFIRKKKLKCSYTGLDFLENFVNISSKKHKKDKKAKFLKLNIKSQTIQKKYDWVLLSGTFNDKHKNSKKDMLKILIKMFKSCRKGIVFNSLSKYVDYEDEKLFYTYPDKIFSFCVKKLSKYVILITDYQLKKGVIPFEYTMCVKKKK